MTVVVTGEAHHAHASIARLSIVGGRMEPIWRLAKEMGVLIVMATDLEDEEAWYLTEPRPGILLPNVPLRMERWLIAHECGHHMYPVLIGNPDWLAEAMADRWAVKTLLDLYDVDQVEWPKRVWPLLPHWEEIAA